MTKPFSPRELVAPVSAALRRTAAIQTEPTTERSEFPDLVVDLDRREVTCDGAAVALSTLEFDLLVALARSPA